MRLFRHKKTGKVYEIVEFAKMEADESPVVIYRAWMAQPVYDDTPPPPVWVRPLREFFDGRFDELDVEAIVKWLRKEAPVWVSPI